MDTTQFLYGILSGMLPSLLWLWFWLKENNLHPEPRRLLATCFFFGMVAVLLAFPLQYFVSLVFTDDLHRYVLWAVIEEILKFGVVYFIIISKQQMDEPIDALIYMITSALGFSALENTFFMLKAINTSTVVSTIITGNLRFMGALLLHVVCSALVGFMIALAFNSSRGAKAVAAFIGIVIAGTLHATFNLAIINGTTSSTMQAFAWVWGGVIVLALLFEEVKAMKPKTATQ